MSGLHRIAVRRTAVTAAVLLTVVLSATAGWSAGLTATASGAGSVSSGSWGVVATQATGTPSAGPLTLSYVVPVLGGPAPQYFSVVNTGSARLTGASYAVGVSGGGLLSSTTLTLTACVGATWSSTTNTCSGTKQVLGTWSASVSAPVASTVVPAATGDRVSVQASVGGSGIVGGLITAVVSSSVSASGPRQLRSATTTIA